MTDATPLASEQITQEEAIAALRDLLVIAGTPITERQEAVFKRARAAVAAGAAPTRGTLIPVTDDKGFVTLHEPDEDGKPGDLVASVWRDDWLAALSATPAPSDQDASQAQGEVPKSWEPIATAPRNREIITVLVPLKEGGFVEGTAYFDPDAYDGTWWWDGTSNADYFTDPISECNHGDPLYWLPDSNTGVQASSLGIMTDQPVSIAATRPAPGATAQDGVEPVGAMLICDQSGGRMFTPWPVPQHSKWEADSIYSDAGGYRTVPLYVTPTPTIPAGMVVVPVEPTDAMWEAFDAWNGDKRTGYKTWRSAWIDMLAAAPKQAEQQGVEAREVTLREAARDLLEARERLGYAVHDRVDLWRCLSAILEDEA